jgi:hypothetical protein
MTTALMAPASRYEVPLLPDLGDARARRELTPAAVRGVVRLADAWQLTTEQVCRLLGDVPQSTWFAWKAKPPADLGTDRLTRVSLLLGAYTALHAVHGPELADRWVRLPSSNPLFAGRTPLEAMAVGGIPVMAAVRALLDGRRGGQ